VGVILGYPSERADPLEREEASTIEASMMAEDVTKLPTGSSEQPSLRQPPTVSDPTAAALPSSTLASAARCGPHSLTPLATPLTGPVRSVSV